MKINKKQRIDKIVQILGRTKDGDDYAGFYPYTQEEYAKMIDKEVYEKQN